MPMLDTIPPDVRQWTEQQIGTLQSAQKLIGGMTNSLYRVSTNDTVYVLRMYDNDEFLASEPDIVRHEAEALQKAYHTTIATPQLIAWQENTACSTPTLLMTHLLGDIFLKPQNMDAWLHEMAKTLATIHALPPDDFQWTYSHWFELEGFVPPTWTKHTDLWLKAYEILLQPAPETPTRFIHRDYHPANLLWQDRRISGVVDWVNACQGAAGIDVAHCRNNLVSLYGVTIANQFMQLYETISGSKHHPYWDLTGLFDSFYEPKVYEPWLALGITGLNDELMRVRADEYLVDIMERI